MRYALDVQHWEFGGLLEASQNAMMASGHCVLTIRRHVHKFGTPDRHCAAQCIQEASYQVIKLKMLSTMCYSNIGMVTKCRLDKTLLRHMWMRMSKNELLRCVLPSLATKNAHIDGCSNKSTILFKLVVTIVQTYWLTLWLLMSPNFCTLRQSLAWQIVGAVYRNDMPHSM
jgi:hypothetical protein